MTALKVYNTQSRQKETFKPIDPERITMYVCGPTVYNFIHIGNARPAVVFDVLFRVLKTLYSNVVYARNITDIDDKIIKAAAENNEAISEVSQRFAAEYEKDMQSLLVQRPSIVPYATDHVGDMIAMIQTLIDRGHAYVAEGHVLFDVKNMENFGALSNRSLEDMLEGARVEVAPYKKYAGDFVLWKPSQADIPGWDSPWGRGRPGWHIECSAMVEKHLGDTIDIHGGGRDLIFPHHENEMAQSCCAHGGKEYVRYWMHNGYINMDGEKMSKSLGNIKTVRGLLEKYSGEVLRFALLSAQYRSELDFSTQLLEQSKASLDSLYGALRKHKHIRPEVVDVKTTKSYEALLDDLNTPIALSHMHSIAHELNKDQEGAALARLKGELLSIGELMGVLQQEPDQWFQAGLPDSGLDAAKIEALIEERNQAKKDKNYARADEIRNDLKDQGIALEDSRDGTTWRKES